MKKLVLAVTILLTAGHYAPAQNVAVPSEQQNKITDPDQEKMMKAAKMMAERQNTSSYPSQSSSDRRLLQLPSNPHTLSTGSCGCDIPLDSTFTPVPFTGTPCSGCPGVPPLYRNDDSYTATPVALPFNFCFYGHTYTSAYINNNGDVTFDTFVSAYTSVPFPLSTDSAMLAPFWADVDTRNPGSGIVYYKVTPTALIVKWDSVGHYSQYIHNLNTFQLIITDGTDPLVPYGNNVSFCYKDMEWTSGTASQGDTNGLNGRPATVGASYNNGVNYLLFGRFDHQGVDYYGPYSATLSGVEWLNNKHFDFNACNGGSNIPPSPSGIPSCDTIKLCAGDTLNLPVIFFSPEINQTTHVNITTSAGLLGWTVFYNDSGATDTLSAQLIANGLNAGINTITFTAIDNGSPHDTTVVNIIISINDPGACSNVLPHALFTSSDTTFCNESGKCINFTDHSTGFPTSWHWDFFGATPDTSNLQNPDSICYYTPGTYPVVLIVSNAHGSDTLNVYPMITLASPPNPPTVSVSNDTLFSSSQAMSYQWYFNGAIIPGATDSFYVYSSVGTYAVQISDGTGCDALSNGFLITAVSEWWSQAPSFSVHPNPARDEFVISHRLLVNGEIDIYDVLGRKIFSQATDGKQQTINCKSFQPGVYFIRLTDEKGSYTGKFVKD